MSEAKPQPPPAASATPDADADGTGSDTRRPPLESLGNHPDSRLTSSGTPPVPAPAPAATRRRPRATLTHRQRDAARLDAEGAPVDRITTTLGTTRSALARWRALPAYQDAVRRERATIGAAVEAELAAGRLAAVRALRGIVEPAGGGLPTVDAAELSSAARALLAASAPPGELTRQRARAELLRRLPSNLRTAVVAALSDDASALDGMTLAELEALEADR